MAERRAERDEAIAAENRRAFGRRQAQLEEAREKAAELEALRARQLERKEAVRAAAAKRAAAQAKKDAAYAAKAAAKAAAEKANQALEITVRLEPSGARRVLQTRARTVGEFKRELERATGKVFARIRSAKGDEENLPDHAALEAPLAETGDVVL
jgi:hypothetical protein